MATDVRKEWLTVQEQAAEFFHMLVPDPHLVRALGALANGRAASAAEAATMPAFAGPFAEGRVRPLLVHADYLERVGVTGTARFVAHLLARDFHMWLDALVRSEGGGRLVWGKRARVLIGSEDDSDFPKEATFIWHASVAVERSGEAGGTNE